MSGVALKANCTENDINELNKIINGQYADGIKKRAQCVILSHQGMLNKDIANTVGFMPRIVGNWIRRFEDSGITGLFDVQKPGRRGRDNCDLSNRIKTLIQEKPPEGAESWTAALLANHLGVSVNVVWRACHDLGISFQRNRQWTYDTQDEMTPHIIEVVGFFFSDEERAIVIRTNRSATCSDVLKGTFTTRNKDLADDIQVIAERKSNEEGKTVTVSLSEVLTAAAEHKDDQRKHSDVQLHEYLNDLMDVLPSGQENDYLVISYSPESNAFNGLNRAGYSFSPASSKEDWLHRAEGFLRTQCSFSMEEEKLISSLIHYSEGINSKTEPFVWKKRAAENKSSLTEKDSERPAPDSEDSQENTDQAEKEKPAEKATTSKPAGEPRIDVQIKYTDSYGNEISQVLSVTEGLMKTQDCDLGCVDSVVRFTENLTAHIIPLMDKASQNLGTIALDSVKKNKF